MLGLPGPLRRRLAVYWANSRGKDIEYLAITKDTTESDLKQRRELIAGNAIYVDQPPVRAALHGLYFACYNYP